MTLLGFELTHSGREHDGGGMKSLTYVRWRVLTQTPNILALF